MQRIAKVIVRILVKEQIIEEEEQEVYIYGFLLLLTSGATTLVILSMGILIHEFILTLSFLAALIVLRHYAGGFHAQTYLRCFSISCLVYVGMLLVTKVLMNRIPIGGILIGSLFIGMYLICVGSLNSEKNPKTPIEMQHRKRMVRSLTLIYNGLILWITIGKVPFEQLAWVLFYVQGVTAVGMWIIKQMRRKLV